MSSALLSPRWLLRHVVVLALVIAFLNLGFWQLRRLHSRRARNAVVTARLAIPAQPLPDVVPSAGADPASLSYRRVVAEGTFDTAREVILPDRSYNERAGNEVVTPLVLADGRAVMVDRGWVPLDDNAPPIVAALPPSGTVRITGVLFASQVRGRFGPRNPDTGTLRQIFRIDLARLQQQLPYTLAPVYVQELSQEPAQTVQYPLAEVLPALDEGPHLSYALQWFAFALIAVVGYGALIRKDLA